jgi:N-hydroxyarylamine O-acetyltransferase
MRVEAAIASSTQHCLLPSSKRLDFSRCVTRRALSPERDYVVDFEVGNHYTSTHPDSPFVNRIMMRALMADGRVTVMNRDVTILRGHTRQTLQLADRAALRALLTKYFGFDLPEVERLRVPSIPEWT